MNRQHRPGAPDQREQAIYAWADAAVAQPATAWEAVSVDASFRRYFRYRTPSGSYIAMDAPPAMEHCGSFIHVADLMAKAGVNVPSVLFADVDSGFLLLTDLGSRRYLEALQPDNADRLFSDAIDALILWQRASRAGALPDYDEALLKRELALFEQWYVGAYLGAALDSRTRAQLERVCALLTADMLAQPRVFVHRDYMPRNLMINQPNPGVLDFQDAVFGPITYDILCLFKDAFVSWDESRVLDWLGCYWRRARRAGLPVAADFEEFRRAWDYTGVQRHLKVIGIFCRIALRDRKPAYLSDIPRFLTYIRATAARHAELHPLLDVLDQLPGKAA